jgi:hypothetical protein
LIDLPDLVRERGTLCEWCETHPATERHHCLFHRMKGHPELDDKRNLMIVCAQCHQSGEVNGYFARCWFWRRQVARYGWEAMMEFYNGVKLKIKEVFW